MSFDFDLFVIGAGSGGFRASRIAAATAQKWRWQRSFASAAPASSAAVFPKNCWSMDRILPKIWPMQSVLAGLSERQFDWPTLRDNVAAEVDRLEGLYGQTLDNNKVEVFRERAVVAGPNLVRLAGGREVSAEHILIATGAWPSIPDIPGAEFGITSNEVFHCETAQTRGDRRRWLYRQ